MIRYLIAFALTLTVTLTAPAAPPNVVMIIGDDQGWHDYGFMGHPHIKTPHLDRLAAEGVTFERAITAAPLTLPTTRRRRSARRSPTCPTTARLPSTIG